MRIFRRWGLFGDEEIQFHPCTWTDDWLWTDDWDRWLIQNRFCAVFRNGAVSRRNWKQLGMGVRPPWTSRWSVNCLLRQIDDQSVARIGLSIQPDIWWVRHLRLGRDSSAWQKLDIRRAFPYGATRKRLISMTAAIIRAWNHTLADFWTSLASWYFCHYD